jgi:hypothetical protein
MTTRPIKRRAARLSALIAALLAAGAAYGAPASRPAAVYHAPRTAFGQPDLQGIWTNSALTFLERPPIFKGLIATEAEEKMMMAGFRQMVGDLLSDKPIDPTKGPPPVVKDAPNTDFLEMDLRLGVINGQKRSSWIVEPADGKIPLTDAGKAAYRGKKSTYDDPEARPLTERCLIAIGSPESPPMLNTGFNANYQFVQSPQAITILVEMNGDARIIRMNDRTHAPAAVTRWLGDSVGWWEGDTLVVETTNFNTRAAVDSMTGGFRYGPNTKVTERFTRTSKDEILYQFTVEDPEYFKQPWKGEMPMRSSKGPIYEYACHEGNYAVANAMQGARYEEAHAPPPAPAAPAAATAPAAAPADLHAAHTGQKGR